METIILGVFYGLITWAAFHDFLTYRIPNGVVLGIFVLAFPYHLLGHSWEYVAYSFAYSLIFFIFGLLLYTFRLLGAGDVKLWTATAFFIGVNHMLWLAFLISIAGGVLGLGYLLAGDFIGIIRENCLIFFKKMEKSGRFKLIFNKNILKLTWEKVEKNGPKQRIMLPYGIAIFAGAVMTLWIRG